MKALTALLLLAASLLPMAFEERAASAGPTVARQDGLTFTAKLPGDGFDVSPVRDAPVTVHIVAHRRGPDGTVAAVEDFDWQAAAVSATGLADLDGRPLKLLVPEAHATGERRTRVAVGEGGALVLTNVVLTGEVVVRHGGAVQKVVDRTVPGFMATLPPLVAILLAIATRQVLLALFVGIWVGLWAVAGGPWGGFETLVGEVLPGALGPSRLMIVMFSCMLGSVVAMVARMGGTKALVEVIAARMGNSPRGAQLTTWLSGIAIFFDDYSNALLVGNTMRPITDRLRISREKLSFLVDSTSAPVACICIISTWIAAEIGYISQTLKSEDIQAATGLTDADAYGIFLRTIPYNFYPVLCLVFGLALCLLRRDFGPMWRAERRAREEGKVLADDAVPLASREMDEMVPVDADRLRWCNAVIPIGTVIAAVVVMLYVTGSRSLAGKGVADPTLAQIFGDSDSYRSLMVAAFLGTIVSVGLAVGQRLLGLGAALGVVTQGIKAMIPAVLVLILAWTLQAVCVRLNTSQWLIHHVDFSLRLLPALVFVLASVTAFATGTSWGTMGILVPLTIEFSVGLATGEHLAVAETAQVMVAAVGAVLAGAVFGDHCSPISDTTIMSSMASGSDHIDHVKTQLPYALTVAGIAIVTGYLPAGFGVTPWLLLPVGAIVAVLAVRFLGRPTEALGRS